ncbi:serine/threonine protein kinase [Clostridium zeae]|uniref:histidine kinase n=1 Tax=Clostridium zeae TaxID=2759022 RepID=A0ABQ1E9C4_9CLOT|nr:AAA family ATPase [Clostridium zeae]GFZ31396.1 serine/threonine protein kinase [Clostridium zeae]
MIKIKGYEIDGNLKDTSLKNLIKNKVIKLEDFFHIAALLINSLDEIHRNKVFHRNITPYNILIDDYENIDIVESNNSIYKKSKNQNQKNIEHLPYYLEYMAPENTERLDKAVDYRANFYSLGIIFYEMLTGILPFDNPDKFELIYSHMAKEAIPPIKINSSIPQVLSDIVMKLMSKMPDDRYQSLIGLEWDLKRCEESYKAKGQIEYFKIGSKDFCNRFLVSSKLYGKDKELKQLFNSLEKVKDGSKELLFIKGSSGVGKSTFINQLYNTGIKNSYSFVTGKFEQAQRELPYLALIHAFEDFISQLLMKSSSELALWRERILNAVGNNGQILTSILPSLKLIIGQQPDVPKLGATEAQNRFRLAFLNFMMAIAQKEHPLVILIDDLQWIDPASLGFIEMLMTSTSIKYLLIIACIGDDDDKLLKPIKLMSDELVIDNSLVNTIELKPLKNDEVELLVKDTLDTTEDLSKIKELSNLAYSKAQGNPFLINQFLQVLYQKGYIWFNYDLMQWCFDLAKIKRLDITENIIEMLLLKFETLSASTKDLLINAACIGNQFDLQTLSLVTNRTLDSALYDLQFAIEEGLITNIKDTNSDPSEDNPRFEFLHERIQQDIYCLLNDKIKHKIHLHIGQLLLEKYSNDLESDYIFEPLRHLNVGKHIIDDLQEYLNLISLNFEAGMIAKEASAYTAAFVHFKTGIEMLCSNSWEENYELTLQLHVEITEMCYLNSNYIELEKYAEIVLNNSKLLSDKVRIYNIKIQAYQAQLKYQEALETGLFVLKLIGIEIPTRPDQIDVEKAFSTIKNLMSGIEPEDLLNLPTMSDPIKLSAMEIMLNTTPATYKTAPMLTPILSCKMVELSLKYGNSPLSPGAYTFYGLSLCTKHNDIELGCRIGNVSIELVGRSNLNQYKAIVLDMNSYSIKHWKDHLRLTLNQFIEGFNVGVENGNFENAACCLAGHAKNSFYLGRPLDILEKEICSNIRVIEKIKICSSLNYEKIFGQIVLNLQGKSKDSILLSGKLCNENEMLSLVNNTRDMVALFFIFLNKTILCYFFGEYSLALKYAKKAEENLSGVAGMFDIAVLYYFDSLSRLALYSSASADDKIEFLTKVEQNQESLRHWSKYAPMNFSHKFHLVEAELLRVKDRPYEAIEHYHKAISMAKEYEYLNDEALANELAGQFWLIKDNHNYARLHLKESYSCYKRWGAVAKIKNLNAKYPRIFNDDFEQEKYDDNSTVTMSELIDFNTIMKASQAISQEIVLDELIKKLIKSIVENIGAEKAVFIMKKSNDFIIKGIKESYEEKITIFQDMKLSEYESLPLSIINYVSRTSESIILENSITSTSFSIDKYIIEQKPKSILCFPLINQKDLKGLIYLENNLITGAFTSKRLKALELLSSQIIISLENARLYNDLEYSNEILDNKVKERTSQLKKERDNLKKYLDIAEVLFFVLDKNGRIVLINRKGCEILGCSEEEIIGKIWHETFIHEKDREKIKTDFEKTINGELVEYSSGVILTNSGEERIAYSRNALLRDENGIIEGTLSCVVDVTEYTMLREQFEYNQLKLELFANLSHELKTPLNLSFCALQMLNLYRNNNVSFVINEKLDKYANIIKQNNYRLLKLVNNIVDITRITSNSFDLNLQKYNIVDIIRIITYSVSDYVENKNRILEFNSDIKNKVIICDPFSIERIILNLLSNAVKFTDEGDKITVNIYDREDSIIIEVEDTGIGIPKNKQEMIFERFRQVDKSFSRNSEGSGIGLTIVKLLVELHQGEISVESHVGKSTRFTIKLPVNLSINNSEIQDQNIYSYNYDNYSNSLIDRLDVEFSDVYGL